MNDFVIASQMHIEKKIVKVTQIDWKGFELQTCQFPTYNVKLSAPCNGNKLVLYHKMCFFLRCVSFTAEQISEQNVILYNYVKSFF
jgi:hypothetical protein